MDGGGKVVTPGSRETILVVDDELMIVRVTTRALEAQGYVVLSASLPSEALRVAADPTLTIHLLLTDVMMPEMKGPELARTLAARRPPFKLLYMSGYAAQVLGEGILDQRAAFLEKPFTRQQLGDKVREVLGG